MPDPQPDPMERDRFGFVAPARPDRWPNFGFLALVVAAGALITGPFLALNYAPTLEAARDSVAYIQEDVTLGWLLRGLHHWAGNFAIVLAALHGWRLFWHGRYKRPRHLLWLLGGGIFLVLVGFAYTGYLLPGDERAFTGLQVMEGIASSTPIGGDEAATVLRGGPSISSAMLTRIYVVHIIVLPAALLGLIAAFALVWRRAGPARHHADETDELAPAWGAALARDTKAAIAVCVAMGACAWLLQPALGPAPDLEGTGSPDARPEWFLLWVNELLHHVEGATFLIGGLLPGLFVGIAMGLPFYARGSEHSPRKRVPEIVGAAVILLFIGVLTTMSLARPPAVDEPDEEPTPPLEADDFDARAEAVMKKFKCRTCHSIDGDEDSDASGPPLYREATGDRPAFSELYTRTFFRLKVGNPGHFWEDPEYDISSMRYPKRAKLPSKEQLATLERWFFDRPAR